MNTPQSSLSFSTFSLPNRSGTLVFDSGIVWRDEHQRLTSICLATIRHDRRHKTHIVARRRQNALAGPMAIIAMSGA